MLTAPCFNIKFLLIPSNSIFALFEYEIIADSKKLDDPAIEVIDEDTRPPVHDSARDIFIFLHSHSFFNLFRGHKI